MNPKSSGQSIQARFNLPLDAFTLSVDLQLPGKGVSVFYGQSGSGKTSLLRCIAGLAQAPQGYLCFRDQVWQHSQQQHFTPTHQRPIGYVFQEASLFPHLNVHKNLAFGRKRTRFIKSNTTLEHAITLLGIEHLLQRMPDKLSGGERQRVAIARALAVCPQLLLMDEPLSSLDPERKQEILPFLQRVHEEMDIPILYVSHSPQEVTRLADYLVVLEAGKVVAAGTLAETLTDLTSPLAQGKQASSVLQVQVITYETAYHLLKVRFSGGELYLPSSRAFTPDTDLRLRIYARDVVLSLQAPQGNSLLNTLQAQITGMVADEQGQMTVQLRLGNTTLLAQITTKAAAVLGLAQGQKVFAQINASAIL